MEQFFHDNSIFIVLTIVLMILVGLIIYTFLLDRKVTKIEKLIADDPNYNLDN